MFRQSQATNFKKFALYPQSERAVFLCKNGAHENASPFHMLRFILSILIIFFFLRFLLLWFLTISSFCFLLPFLLRYFFSRSDNGSAFF